MALAMSTPPSLKPLFVTEIYQAHLGESPSQQDLIVSLHEAILDLAEMDRAGQLWCREHGYRGYTSYGSLSDLPLRDPVFAELKRQLDRHALAYARGLQLDMGRKPRLDSLWVNILKPGAGHSGHIHPHSVISGTLYVSVPEGASALKLEDPRLGLMMARPTVQQGAPEQRQPFVYLTPQPGTVLMWESWLRHEVPPNGARKPRVSISFNYR